MSLLDLEGNALIGQSREWNVSLSGAAVSGEGTGSPIQRTAAKARASIVRLPYKGKAHVRTEYH